MASRVADKPPRGNYLDQSYLKEEELSQCIPRNAPLTVKHLLVDFIDFAPTRQRFLNVDNVITVKIEAVFEFLREIGLY